MRGSAAFPRGRHCIARVATPTIDASVLRETIVRLLLAIPFIGLLWLPFYNRELPSLFGFPFFYWYQLLWVPITAFLIWLVFRSEQKGERTGEQKRGVT